MSGCNNGVPYIQASPERYRLVGTTPGETSLTGDDETTWKTREEIVKDNLVLYNKGTPLYTKDAIRDFGRQIDTLHTKPLPTDSQKPLTFTIPALNGTVLSLSWKRARRVVEKATLNMCCTYCLSHSLLWLSILLLLSYLPMSAA